MTATSVATESDPKFSGVRLAVAVAGWIAFSVAAGFATGALANMIVPEWASDPDHLATVIVVEVYAILVALMLLVVGGGKRTRSALALLPSPPRDIAMALVALVAAYSVSAIGYAILHAFVSPDPSVLDIMLGVGSDGGRLANAGPWSTGLIIARISILVPIGEELLFRGALFGWLRLRLSARVTISITAVLFAVIHQFLIVLPLAFLWGAAIGWVRERTGSVVPGIVAHSVNGLCLLALSFAVTGWTAELPF
ncbi:MAG TPA: type II CAAX endopeptidase family protein [Acidimicrobiia bacterium]